MKTFEEINQQILKEIQDHAPKHLEGFSPIICSFVTVALKKAWDWHKQQLKECIDSVPIKEEASEGYGPMVFVDTIEDWKQQQYQKYNL